MKAFLFNTLFLFIFSGFGFGQGPVKDFDYGRMDVNKYINAFFDFEITIPEKWVVQNKAEMEALSTAGKELVAGDNAQMKAALNAAKINSANLLMAFQFERGSAVAYNPSLSIVAENVQSLPGMKTGNEYLFQVRRILELSQVKYDYLDKEFSKETIHGIVFFRMNTEINYMGLEIKQMYYSTILKGFGFSVVASYITDEQKATLQESIQGMKFKGATVE